MTGRIFGIKKSILMQVFEVVSIFEFVALTLSAFLYFKIPSLWFFAFCFCVGKVKILKGILFKFDSAFALGSFLFCLSIGGSLIYLLPIMHYAATVTLTAFALSSLMTFLMFHQSFMLIFSYSTTFVTIFSFILTENLITTPIFIAFVVPFLLQLVVSIILHIKKGI